MADLIIGAGEVGQALYRVLRKAHKVKIRDKKPIELKEPIRYLHITIPYTDGSFVNTVNNYIDMYKPRITVVHSTVQIGTTDKLVVSAVHSPIVGVHRSSPTMEECLLTFDKWVAGKGSIEIAEYFAEAGMVSHAYGDPKITEAAKLFCTTTYGVHIAFTQELNRICEKYNLPFETVVQAWNINYNLGYQALGMAHVTRPILTPGVIGGHCVMPNIDILMSLVVPQVDNPLRLRPWDWLFLRDVKKSNYRLSKQQLKRKR